MSTHCGQNDSMKLQGKHLNPPMHQKNTTAADMKWKAIDKSTTKKC
jgi:hypothetical protein